jgi:iron complex transport system ATP-binding protein
MRRVPKKIQKTARVDRVEVVLEARELTVAYGDHTVLDRVSLEARAGEVLAVLGPNGAGKSTLLRTLSGTLPASSGSVSLGGRDMTQLSRREIAQTLAVVPQDSVVAFGFRVGEVVGMGRAPHQSGLLLMSPEDARAIERAVRRCGLAGLESRRITELSGGERRLTTIARALAQTPKVLLLDEAAAHLDVKHSVLLYGLTKSEARDRNVACVAVMHDLNAAAKWADRVLLLSGSRVRAVGPPDEILEPELLEEVFGVPIRVLSTDEGRWYSA